MSEFTIKQNYFVIPHTNAIVDVPGTVWNYEFTNDFVQLSP